MREIIKNKKNKKGQLGKQMMLFYFIFLLIIIGLGIVGGIYIFFGKEYDFREREANLISYKVERCIAESDNIEQIKNNFYSACGIKKEVFEKTNAIRVLDGNDVLYSYGDVTLCEGKEIEKSEEYPKCFVKVFGKYKIIVASNQRIEVEK
ncbi:MAG: hypothetical protein N3D20_01420 [Candidatus Pacearchaeota archaeon]|nr:hypothetical protein [Candidatus Pacearchaeota archaeon]